MELSVEVGIEGAPKESSRELGVETAAEIRCRCHLIAGEETGL